jgi:signal transduction histidine kinase
MYWKLKFTFALKNSFLWLSSFIHSAEVIFLGLVYLVMLSYNILILVNSPQLDLTITVPRQSEAYITLVTPGGILWEQGIRAGDQVLALNGRAPVVQDMGYWSGQNVQVQTHTGAIRFIDARSLPNGLNSWPLLLLSPWFFLFGLLVYARAQDRSIAGATQSLFASVAFAMALAPAAIEDRMLITSVEFVAVTMFAPCFLRFFLVFPTYRGSRQAHAAIFIPPLAVSVLGLLSLWLPSLYEVAARLRLILLLGYLGAGVVLILYFLARQRDTHSGVTIVGLGTVVSILPFLVLYLVPMLFLGQPALAAEYAILPLALLPISFAYAILRHNILNIALIQRWLIHGLLLTGLVILYTYLIVTIVRSWFVALLVTPLISAGVVALLVIIIGLTFQRLYKRMCRMLDHVFFKDNYDYHAVLQNLSHDLSTARDIDTLGVELLRTLWELVNVEFAVLLLRDQQNQQDLYVHALVGVGPPALLTALTKIGPLIPETSNIISLPINKQTILTVPLRVHNLIVGYICLGPKVKGEPFRTQDRDLLTTLSVQIAALIRNTQLVEDLRMKVNTLDALNERLLHVHEDERAKMAADIHDEPLQTAIHLQRLLATTANRDAQIRPIIPLSQTLIDQLRNVCMAMRPVALDDLGLIAALDALAQEQSDRLGVPIFLDIDVAMTDLVLTSTIELVLYRAAQEAVNNSLRHAHPQTVHITFWQQDGFVQLLITDDGQGFSVPVHLDSLVIQGHLGLVGMQERIQHSGGKLDITSTPGLGTSVHLAIPLKRSSHDSGDVG